MIKKKVLVAGVIAATLCSGLGVVSARIIRGVDRPFNEAAYYSMTEIDYADSPSTFFFRDLAGQGMQVIDITRKIKSTFFADKFGDVAQIFINMTLNKIINQTGVNDDEKNRFNTQMNEMTARNQNIGVSQNIYDTADSKLFLSTTNYDYDKADPSEQLKYLDSVYKDALQSAQDNLSDSRDRADAINRAAIVSAQAKGEVEAHQAESEMQALETQELIRRNQLIANYNAVEAAHQMKENDEEIRSAQTRRNQFLKVVDPYNAKGADADQYERPEAPGFPDF